MESQKGLRWVFLKFTQHFLTFHIAIFKTIVLTFKDLIKTAQDDTFRDTYPGFIQANCMSKIQGLLKASPTVFKDLK